MDVESQSGGFTGGRRRGHTEEALDGVDPDLVQSPRDPPALQQAAAPGTQGTEPEDRTRGQNQGSEPGDRTRGQNQGSEPEDGTRGRNQRSEPEVGTRGRNQRSKPEFRTRGQNQGSEP